MTIELLGPNDTGDIPTGDPTINLASHAYRLRMETRQRINPAYLHSAETLILNVATGLPYRPAQFVELGHTSPLADSMIGEFDTPPVGPSPVPPPPPPGPTIPPRAACTCCSHEEKPLGKRGRRRAVLRVSPWWTLAAFVAGGATVYAGLALGARLAVLAVFG